MKKHDNIFRTIAWQRLCNQQITRTDYSKPVDIVSHLGAMQAQDYQGVKWSIGLRLSSSVDADIEAAVTAREIVRTWPQRGTLHLVAAKDVRWMLALLAPRNIAGSALRRRQLELDDKILKRCFSVLTKALEGGRILSRPAVMELLEKARISTKNNRGYHILWQAALAGLICFGPMAGKQHSFVLLDEWLPLSNQSMERDEMLAELAARYFLSRGPATLKDFLWWSGLIAADARRALEAAASRLASETIGGETYWIPLSAPDPPVRSMPAFLLPGFDEYLLGYANRGAVLDPEYMQRIVPGNNGMFFPTVILNGRVAGTWKRSVKSKTSAIEIVPFETLSKPELRSLSRPADHLGKFFNTPHQVRVSE